MLTKDQIISAMTLDADGVTAALRNNFQDESVLTAVFMGMTMYHLSTNALTMIRMMLQNKRV